jgi:hypothetical protein
MSLAKPKWYRTNIGVGAALLFFFPVGLYLLWSHPDWSKKSKWIVTAIVAVFILIAVSSPKSTPTATAEVVASPSPIASATPTPSPQPQTMTDKLVAATKVAMGKIDGYSVAYDEATKTATLTAEPSEKWDETAEVQSGYSALVKFGMEAFKVDGVDEVAVNMKVNGTDGYGKPFVESGVKMGMTKVEFAKYDWKNLNLHNVETQMITSCSQYYIAPFLLKNVDHTKLYLYIL